MTYIFISVLNMSITASYVALTVIATRLLLKKAPKVFCYALWSVVLFRLVCPFSFSSTFSFLSLLHSTNEYIPQNIGVMEQPTVNLSVDGANSVINNILPAAAPLASANPMGIIMDIAADIWLIIMVILLIYSVVSYLKTKGMVKHAIPIKDNIYETNRISTPFVLGFIHPKIYIPSHITLSELPYILQHEQTHIKRLDYLIKPVAFLALILHWFNPLMWLCYSLMSKDMEMSCDESVMKHTDSDIRRNYSQSLLSCSTKQSGLLSPLAFGESNVRSRIKNVLNYKRPTFWLSAVALIAVLVIAVSLISNTVNRDVPQIYIHTENDQSKEAILGTYGWDFGYKKVQADASIPTEFQYGPQNTITAQKGQQMILSNQRLNKDKKVSFTLAEIRCWDADMSERNLNPDSLTFHNGDLYINAPEEVGEYIYGLHLEYERGNVFYGFKVAVIELAPMKGLELYVWKNKEVTGNSDTYYTLLLGTNRNKEEREIYDLDMAVSSIDKLNEMLNKYNTQTELFIYQMNTTDFTKAEMGVISEQIKFPFNGNGMKAIGLWQNTPAPEESITEEVTIKIEEYLQEIMSSPKTSSNPQDYINAHQIEYESILRYDETALKYLLHQFEKGDNNDLRGHIMRQLIKELLGDRNNVSDESLSPQEWFNKLSVPQ